MRRRSTALLALFPLAFALGACGDDGGSASAFCDRADAISALEGSDTPSERDLNLLQDFADAAPDELKDDFDVLLEAFSAIVDGDESALGDIDISAVTDATSNIEEFVSDECGVDLGGDSTTTTSGDEETTTTTSGDEDTTTTTEDTGGDNGGSSGDLPDAAPTPDLDDPTEADHAEACHDGDLDACDQLYTETPIGSEGEAYGQTCGGRLDESNLQYGTCADYFGGGSSGGDGGGTGSAGDPTDPPTDGLAGFEELAQQCYDGSGEACDQLYNETPAGSDLEAWADTCGGRFEAAQPDCGDAIGR